MDGIWTGSLNDGARIGGSVGFYDTTLRDGVIPDAEHVPLSVLPWRTEQLAGRRVCLVCTHGYSSSLAAALLVELGVEAGDLIGGYEAW